MNLSLKKEQYQKLKDQLAFLTIQSSFKKIGNNNLNNNCQHEIMILLGYKEFNNLPVYKCMFCEQETNCLKLENSIIINAVNYDTYNFDMNKEEDTIAKFNIVRNHIMNMIQNNPEMTNEELERMANQSLNGYSYVIK